MKVLSRTFRALLGAPALVALLATAASAQPSMMPLQGMLTDADGYPVAGDDIPISFRIYTVPTGGTPIHSEDTTIDTDNGWFTHMLGTSAALDLDHFQGGGVWLGVSVNGEFELLPRIDLGTVAYAAFARNAGSVAWSNVTGVPADLADGDNDTLYFAAAPIERVGTTFTLSTTGCAAGEGWIWSGSAWECAPAGSVSYTAGTGLALAGSQFSVDTATIQRRVTGTCTPGQYMIAINSLGGAECEPLPAASAYTAGTGLSLTGSQFAINPAQTQRRVTGTCPVGQYMIAVAQDGTVSCEPLPAGVTYSAGTGLTLVGSAFAIDPTLTQRRVTGECPAGQYMRSVAQDGSVACLPLPDAITYTGGAGILLAGSTINVDPTFVQRRVSTACPAGQAIRAISETGAVVCETFVDTNTTYTAGAGLTLTGNQFSVTPNVFQNRVLGACTATSAIRAVGADGSVVCSDIPQNGITTLNQGFGITVSGTGTTRSVAINTAEAQRRVTGTCAANQKILGINADGSVVCAADSNSGGTLTAVNGTQGITSSLSGSTVTLGIATNTIQTRITGSCAGTNRYIQSINENGSVNCGDLNNLAVRNISVEMITRGSTMLGGGGYIGWHCYSGTCYMYWDDRFITIANGQSANYSTNGHFDITYPAGWNAIGVGTGNQHFNGWPFGVHIPCWNALYYVLPIGSSSGTQPGNFRLVNYFNSGEIPAEWQLIAVNHCDQAQRLFVNANGGIQLWPAEGTFGNGNYWRSYYPWLTHANCGWTGFVNNWDAVMNFICSDNRMIAGAYSVHDNGREDRRWDFYCCGYPRF